MEKPPASMALEKLKIPHQVFRHENPLRSFEQAAEERQQRPEQIVRSILFQIRPEEFLMVLVAGRESDSTGGVLDGARGRTGTSRLEEITPVCRTVAGAHGN
jgi:hypothetical protein